MRHLLPPPHPKLLSNALPVSLSMSPADLLQLLHLLLTPLSLIDGWVEEVLPETTNVLRILCPFKLRRRREEESRREEEEERGEERGEEEERGERRGGGRRGGGERRGGGARRREERRGERRRSEEKGEEEGGEK